jgi:alpha-D-xyloside xylohydrolase
MTETEPWKYGQTVEDNMRKMLELRYRLLPYIYSEAWQVTKNGSTMMRPMVMDFNGDVDAVKQSYQYMFGKAFLVAPVTESGVKEWSVYLPKGAAWYDFWTGEELSGGKTVVKETPLEIMPLHIKAGSILPVGPKVQYATEKKWDNLEIRVYKGANGNFTLYEDEGDNYNYEKGAFSTITFTWNDTKKVLTINDRSGSYPGMLTERKFNITLVGAGKNAGYKFDNVVTYKGKKVVIKL